MVLDRSFYLCSDVVQVARDLLGKYLYCLNQDGLSGGIIIETEAYAGVVDKASHAYGDRRTVRTEVMYRQGGTAYIYLCYGMHSLFNVVTNLEGIPHAVLVRGIIPTEGLDLMAARSSISGPRSRMANGPGKLTKLLGITYHDTGIDLTRSPGFPGAQRMNKEVLPGWPDQVVKRIWIEDKGLYPESHLISEGRRIGVDYAGEDALLPYRFCLKDFSKF